MSTAPSPAELAPRATNDERFAHLVLKADWPIALCGARVTEHLGARAPARDRCPACLKYCSENKLGRPGWDTPEV